MGTEDVLRDVGVERIRQENLRQSGKFLWSCAAIGVSPDRKLSVLSEEVGEVAKEVVELGITADKYEKEQLVFPLHRKHTHMFRIRKELIEVAAVCVAWVEAIDLWVYAMNLEKTK